MKINNIELKEADILFASESAEAFVEDALQEIFDGSWEAIKEKILNKKQLTFDHFGHDSYDGSIEIYVSENATFDEQRLIKELEEFGFTMGWINFDDGSEIHFYQRIFGQRTKKEHPRWTKEIAREHNS